MTQDINPKVWGPSTWSTLYYVFAAHNHDNAKLNDFLTTFAAVLPCSACQNHMMDYMEMNPLKDGSDSLLWLYNFNSSVRKRTSTTAQLGFSAWNAYYGNTTKRSACRSSCSGRNLLKNKKAIYLSLGIATTTTLLAWLLLSRKKRKSRQTTKRDE
jgi:hypothetical protein